MSYVKIGVGGPVGSGKTALIERLTRKMSKEYSICVVTNDIYTKEDAEFLIKNSALPAERIVGVETGGCPHTAIREDCSMNLEAVEEMAEKFPDVEIIFIESGGDNLSATFSPDLADVTIYVIDVAQGEKIPRKRRPRCDALRSSGHQQDRSGPHGRCQPGGDGPGFRKNAAGPGLPLHQPDAGRQCGCGHRLDQEERTAGGGLSLWLRNSG